MTSTVNLLTGEHGQPPLPKPAARPGAQRKASARTPHAVSFRRCRTCQGFAGGMWPTPSPCPSLRSPAQPVAPPHHRGNTKCPGGHRDRPPLAAEIDGSSSRFPPLAFAPASSLHLVLGLRLVLGLGFRLAFRRFPFALRLRYFAFLFPLLPFLSLHF